MRELSRSLHSFIEALQKNESIYLSFSGKWRVDNPLIKWIRRVIHTDVYAKIQLLIAFNYHFDRLEEIPINFSKKPGVFVSQQRDFHGYLSAAQNLILHLQREKNPTI